MKVFPRINRKKVEVCSHEFVHDERVPYRSHTTPDGTTTETWREACRYCGTWIIAERVNGEMV